MTRLESWFTVIVHLLLTAVVVGGIVASAGGVLSAFAVALP